MVYIIAEAGVNHNGSLIEAKKLIKAAKNAGADAVKFQTFKAESLILEDTKKAEYQRRNSSNESQYEMLKKLELSYSDFVILKKYAEDKKIDFLSSAFDLEALEFLISLNLSKYKIPSGEITNKPMLKIIGSLNKPTILSTGMCYIKEIQDGFDVLTTSGLKKDNITILHCNTDYPTKFIDVNLLAMQKISEIFKVDVGYSDHTLGNEVSVAAVALGAKVIEKHLTLDNTLDGPDHSSSLDPDQFENLVKSIRNTESALGKIKKTPSSSEKANIFYARKSIVASKAINKGDIFTEENLDCKRPAGGISPMHWDSILGKIAKREYSKGEYIEK